MEDTRKLIPMRVKKIGDNLYSIDIDGGESYNVECDYDSIKKVFRRIKAKDGENCGKCRSSKVGTYASMIGFDKDDEFHKINVWKSKVPHSALEFKSLMENKEENINMNQIKLTKNYLIEGHIVSKGTIVEFKEKLDFLPSDIWERAKDIKDEHERFEFIKNELNKLDADYSDDEIEDFINKYKKQLNESVKKISKNDLNDMILVIKETSDVEKLIDSDSWDEFIEECKTNKKLTDAWVMLLKANDDDEFHKCEVAFWDLFDEICSKFKTK